LDPARAILRHTLATLAYRAAKTIRGAPDDFSTFRIAIGTRTPGEIVAHMADLMEWATTMTQGRPRWRTAAAADWRHDVDRLFAAITSLDAAIAGDAPIETALLYQLLQGPIADALTHTGQLALLRRLAGAPIKGENFPDARIAAGQTGFDQPPPGQEFG
jgi:hypothetical protein